MNGNESSGDLTARQNAQLRERLAALCEREGLSKRALASKAGISVGAVLSIGTTKAGPKLGTMLALVRALGLQSIDQLLGPSPTAMLTASDRIEVELGDCAMRVLMQTDGGYHKPAYDTE